MNIILGMIFIYFLPSCSHGSSICQKKIIEETISQPQYHVIIDICDGCFPIHSKLLVNFDNFMQHDKIFYVRGDSDEAGQKSIITIFWIRIRQIRSYIINYKLYIHI